jgi:hypothetical protein
MKGARRAVGIGAFIVLALGTAWALEHRSSSRMEGGVVGPIIAPAVIAPQEESGAGPTTPPDSQQEYDRSDLQLTQG